jgi:hypothetical protein
LSGVNYFPISDNYSFPSSRCPAGFLAEPDYLRVGETRASPQPNASTLNNKAGLITSNSAHRAPGTNGSINVFVTDATDVLIDINGYYFVFVA